MADISNSTVYIGNMDDRVSERVLYDILIQAGRVVDLHIPRDKETDKPKGYAFAVYESEEIAEYAVKLFSGLVTLYKRTLRFGISGQDKPSVSVPITNSPMVNSSSFKPRSHPVPYNNSEFSPQSARVPTSRHFSEHKISHTQVPSDVSGQQPNGYLSYHDSTDYDHSRRVFGSDLDSVNRSKLGRYDMRRSNKYYPPY